MSNVLSRLKDELREIDRLLHEESRRAEPDRLVIRELQRQRMQIKDELFLARAGLRPLYI